MFTVAPILFGLDKFANLLVRWPGWLPATRPGGAPPQRCERDVTGLHSLPLPRTQTTGGLGAASPPQALHSQKPTKDQPDEHRRASGIAYSAISTRALPRPSHSPLPGGGGPAGRGASGGRCRLGVSGLLRNRDFRHLCAADAISKVGTGISNLALSLLAVVTLHASTFDVSMLKTLGAP